jgi:prepilin-type N-terminal cleavage/methylation domain-containing protein
MEHAVNRIRARMRLDDPMRAQSGFSLIELVVAMTIFSIFVGLFLIAVVGLARGTTRAKLTAESSSGVLLVFQNIDRQVRYADAITVPGQGASGSRYRYVEFRTPAASTREGVTKCTQWRFDSVEGVIASRQWPALTFASATPWSMKVDTVIDSSATDYPFALVKAAAGASTKQQLALTIDAGNESMNAGASISTTYVARNSSLSSPTNLDVAGANPSVCWNSASRP